MRVRLWSSWLSIFAVLLLTSSCLPPKTAGPKKVAAEAVKKPADEPSEVVSRKPKYPPSERQDVVDTIHGQKVADPYRWLEKLTPKTKQWLQVQDRYGRAYLGKLSTRDKLAARLKELAYVEWVSAPLRRGKYYFFSRQHKDKEKVVYYVQRGLKGKPKVLIDPNTLSKDGSISVRGMSYSYDGRRVAYKLSENNADESTLYLKDVRTGKISTVDKIVGAKYAHASWTPRGDGFYYTRLPVDPKIKVSERPGYAAVYYHKVGQDPSKDRLVHAKTGDPRTFIHASLSRDGRYLFFYIHYGWTRSDVYFKDLRRDKKFRPFAVGLKAKYGITAWKNRFYVHTNLDAPNWRLFKVNPRQIDRAKWTEIVPEQKEAVLDSVLIRGGHLSLQYLRRASTMHKVATLDGKVVREVKLPGIGTTGGMVGNPEDDVAYYAFSSFNQPMAVYKTSMRRGGSEIHFETKVPVDPSPYLVEQIHYPSKDGTKISMFIVRRKDLPRDGSTPFMLYGYGGFNISLTPKFRGEYFAWLEQGAGIAIPNLRGGGEYGEAWHQAGMLTRKQNVFDDFIAAAEYLIKNGYTKSERLAIRGGSNGGLLVGAAMTQRPDLFRAVACHVPLLDMVRYHLFGSGKTWISEYGSAEDKEQFEALLGYSPYHRVKDGTAYPSLMMFTADSDDRVDPMHARKFVAAVQHATASANPVMLRLETKSGHGGGDMIKKKVEARADEFAFLLDQIKP